MNKVTIFILLALCLNVTTFAQDAKQAYRNNLELFYEHFREANYEAMKKLAPRIEQQYLNLSSEDQTEMKGTQTGLYYNFACLFSIVKDADTSLLYLKKASEMGWNNYAHLMSDGDLEFIRQDERFLSIAEEIKKEGDYLSILKNTGAYKKIDAIKRPLFTYQSADNPDLQRIRKHFNLDSIAGQGDEVSKIIKLMTWVHDSIRHDGNHWPDCDYNAIGIYNYWKETGRGVNCRALAIVLNDCYLAMGLKSRFVVCLPKNEGDSDCHAINSVYSETLDKWLWMDPTNNAYVMDENGNLLSIAEVRERLIADKPLVLNANANWNNIEPQVKGWYLDWYMAKNLYAFQVLSRSEFEGETIHGQATKTHHVYLLPVGYERTKKNNNVFFSTDSDYFWQTPK